jgi:8-oxo-dGTP pyrophosphatase MutT (NUDIX family)
LRLTLDTLTELLQSHKPQEVAVHHGRTAGVAMVLAPVPNDFEILLMKRSEREGDPWSGQISLPGGHAERDDGSLCETARRETLEEMGLRLGPCPGWQLDDVHPKTRLIPQILVRPFVFVVEPVQQLSLGNEAEIDIRVRLQKLAKSRCVRTVVAQGRIMKVSGFRVGSNFVWGLTERVLTNFMHVIGV